MVPFYGTVYKSILYDLIIPFPRGRNGKNDVRLFLRPGRPEKANNLIINSLWIVFYAEWHQLPFRCCASVSILSNSSLSYIPGLSITLSNALVSSFV